MGPREEESYMSTADSTNFPEVYGSGGRGNSGIMVGAVAPGTVITNGGNTSTYWELTIPEHIKEKFDEIYKEKVREYVRENILRQDIVIKDISPQIGEYGHGRGNRGLLVTFKPALEVLAGDDKR